jgi:hypothetical protein
MTCKIAKKYCRWKNYATVVPKIQEPNNSRLSDTDSDRFGASKSQSDRIPIVSERASRNPGRIPNISERASRNPIRIPIISERASRNPGRDWYLPGTKQGQNRKLSHKLSGNTCKK